jgi:hypothetical protein
MASKSSNGLTAFTSFATGYQPVVVLIVSQPALPESLCSRELQVALPVACS